MKVITWNINSLRLRLKHIKKLVEQESPDILCLQETKVSDDLFPMNELKDIGFKYIFFTGEKSYNGIAILSNICMELLDSLKFINDDKRHISVRLPKQNIELHNFYIPAGGYEPDEKINPKFTHKLEYCDQVANWFLKNRGLNDKVILLGDLNIAPMENDVWSHKQLLNVVSHTSIEITKLNNIYKTINFVDTIRKFYPENEKIYSWWSYRNKDWKKSNRGRRLDHIWVSANLADKVDNAYILKEARDWHLPSDHAPVITNINE